MKFDRFLDPVAGDKCTTTAGQRGIDRAARRSPAQVLLLDPDRSSLRGLERLVAARGHEVRAYEQPEPMLRAGIPPLPACLVLEQRLGQTTGTALQAELAKRGWNVPAIFLSDDRDPRTVVQAMRGGADDYLTKPCEPERLLDALDHALTGCDARLRTNPMLAEYRLRVARLTARERQIAGMVAAGLHGKEICDQLHLSLGTVKIHRSRAMHKLGAGNLAELARIAASAGLHIDPDPGEPSCRRQP